MALSISEATAVNRLYDWLTDRDSGIGPTSDKQAQEALATLARAAKRALMAGVTEQQVTATKRWPALGDLRARARAWDAVEEILHGDAAGERHASPADVCTVALQQRERLARPGRHSRASRRTTSRGKR